VGGGVNETMNARGVNARLRQQEALKLRAQGKAYREIASALGYRGPSGAFRAVSSALAKVQHEGVVELRALHAERINALVESLWSRRSDPQVATAVLRCLERESKLYGADAPSKVEIGRLLETDDWQQVKDAIRRALAAYPAAAQAVAEALRGIEGD
jgi:hypothetical protein